MRETLLRPLTSLRTHTMRAWVAFCVGTILLSGGIGAGLIGSGLGTGPIDALTVGSASTFGASVGVWSLIISLALVGVAAVVGHRPSAGTVLAFVTFSVLIDVFIRITPTAGTLSMQVTQWVLGALALAAGSALMIASNIGASPYDMVTIALSRATRGRVGLARLILDAVITVAALVLGGPIAWGTAGLMILMPFALPAALRHASAFVAGNEVEHARCSAVGGTRHKLTSTPKPS